MKVYHFRYKGLDAYGHDHKGIYKATARSDVYIYRHTTLMRHYITKRLLDEIHFRAYAMMRMREILKDVMECQSEM